MDIGDKLPQEFGYDADGNLLTLDTFKGKKLILYFYPKDNTSGCTAEACSLRDSWEDIRKLGYEIVGVSKDSSASHKKFAGKYSLPFPLIADTEHKLAEECGVWQLKKMAGREYYGVVRTTFITNENGVITDVIRKVKTKDAAAQIFELLDGRGNPNPA